MKTVKALALILALALLSLSFAACGFSADFAEFEAEADTQVKMYLDYLAEHNEDAMYDMLYPGIVERESFDKTNEQMEEYCPITKEYQINRTSYDVNYNSQIGKEKRKTFQGIYDLIFEEKEYVVITIYTKAGEACGFTRFQIVTRAEYEAANKQSK